MPGDEGLRIDPESPTYREVARLYRIAHEMRPGSNDRWNGELYARGDGLDGGLMNDGTLRLSPELVLDHLAGGERSDDPAQQGDALATVLHESLHARVETDARDEPNAVRAPQSFGLDEGLTELVMMDDYDEFVRQAGYEHAEMQDPKYSSALQATSDLLDRATSSDTERTELLNSALDRPVAMRWDTIADSVVRKELGDTVPSDAAHQQAARAHVIDHAAHSGWATVHRRNGVGPLVAADTDAGLERAVADLKTYYAENSTEPYPARDLNPEATRTTRTTPATEQLRATTTADRAVDFSKLPPPDAGTRVSGTNPSPGQEIQSGGGQGAQSGDRQPASANGAQPAARAAGQQGDPMRFLDDQSPAAHATRPGRSLGDGARGAGAPAGPSVNRPAPSRAPSPDHGRGG
jgi:hypothetical protein